MIPKNEELSLNKLSDRLALSLEWIKKAVSLLKLQCPNDKFSLEQYYLLRNAKAIMACGADWGFVVALYEKEQKVRADIIAHIEKLNELKAEGQASLGQSKTFYYFMLAEPVAVPFDIDENYEVDKFKPETDISGEIEYLFFNASLYNCRNEFGQKAYKTIQDLKEFMQMSYYQPIKLT
ncbi:MAG: hypothetical protein GY858_02200 [Candidatus Omnitrophica bacterium]|nr:hypothetical protein [Candidatus Omnitrophota bacterium]